MTAKPPREWIEAAEITTDRFLKFSPTSFKYFCGICWRKIKQKSQPEGEAE